MEFLIVVILGLMWGSYSTTLIACIVNNKSYFEKPICFNCKTKLSIKEFFPIFSFFIYKGKCKFCNKKYEHSIIYFSTELMLTILFIVAYIISEFYINIIFISSIFTLGTVLLMVNIINKELPIVITIPLLIICLLYNIFNQETYVTYYNFYIASISSFLILIFINIKNSTKKIKLKIFSHYIILSLLSSLCLSTEFFIAISIISIASTIILYFINTDALRVGTIFIPILFLALTIENYLNSVMKITF